MRALTLHWECIPPRTLRVLLLSQYGHWYSPLVPPVSRC